MKILNSLILLSACTTSLVAHNSNSQCWGPSEPCPTAPVIFSAKGSETRKITIGGNITTQYQYIDVNDDKNAKHLDPEEYNNFLMPRIRLNVDAQFCEGWSGYMSLDFGCKSNTNFNDYTDEVLEERRDIGDGIFVFDEYGECAGFTKNRSCQCIDNSKFSVDQAYIQKIWLDNTIRIGYQKVNWGAEENTPRPHLKTIERSVATNYFKNLGFRATGGSTGNSIGYIPYYCYAGNKTGGRHTGIFLAGQSGPFHYSGAITNGYQGICCNSNFLNNSLGFYASLAFEFGIDCIDFLAGVNTAFQPKGGNKRSNKDLNVWGINPYIFAQYNRYSVMAEFFHGSVEDGKITARSGDADPWGFNLIPSMMLNDKWELVGRFSYVNSDQMGMTIHDTYGCTPDNAFGDDQNFIASQIQFEKVYAAYIGINYYMLNGAVKASFGLEQAKFKNRADDGFIANLANGQPLHFDAPNNKGAKVNAARAQLQFLF